MIESTSDPRLAFTPPDRWELVRVDDDSWRIYDLTQPRNNAECLIAYVDRHPTGTLNVLWLCTSCPRMTKFKDFERLLETLNLARANALDRSRAPSPIAHRPPI